MFLKYFLRKKHFWLVSFFIFIVTGGDQVFFCVCEGFPLFYLRHTYLLLGCKWWGVRPECINRNASKFFFWFFKYFWGFLSFSTYFLADKLWQFKSKWAFLRHLKTKPRKKNFIEAIQVLCEIWLNYPIISLWDSLGISNDVSVINMFSYS